MQALTYLLITYEKLKEYDNAYEVIESLDELKVNVTREKLYINALQIINDPILSFEKKSNQLMELFKSNNLIERVVIQYLLQFNKTLFWKNIELFNPSKSIDLLWYLSFEDVDFDAIPKDTLLLELYSAKGYINEKKLSSIFELNILIMLQKDKTNTQADLNFEFICEKCKQVHPIYDSRCPHCHSILTFKIEPEITRSFIEENQSLQ